VKILYIIDQTNLFGSELHVYDLVKKLGPHNQIKVIAFNDGPLIKAINDLNLEIEISIVKLTWFSGFLKSNKIIGIIRKFSPEIVHSHQPKAIFYGSIFSKLAEKKHIATIHSIPNGFAQIYHGLKRAIVLIFHTFVQYVAEALSTKSIFITHYNREKFSLFKNKSVVIYNWVSDRLTTNTEKSISVNKDSELNYISFLSAGSIDENKGFKELLALFKQLKGLFKFNLLIAGVGNKEIEDYLKTYIADNSMQSEVRFLGYQNNLGVFYNNAHYFILLPKEEAFGLVYIEAMQFGLPVICSDLPQLREIIPAENIFIKSGQSLGQKDIEKICDEKYRENVGLINKSVSHKLFNIDVQIKLVSELYLSLA